MTDTDQPRRLEYMPLSDLYERRDPTNVKGHADGVIDASMARFGYIEPIVLDERTGKLVAGHGRVERLVALGGTITADHPVTPPEGVITNADGGGWQVPVMRGWASANDDEARAAGITLNRAGEVGGWTDELAMLLADLGTTDAGLPPGFTPDDLDTLLAELGTGELDPQDTAADHADDLTGRGDPAIPRQAQGLHEVGLMFQDQHHAEWLSLLAQLRKRWQNPDMPAPMVVLRALRQALHYDGTEDGE